MPDDIAIPPPGDQRTCGACTLCCTVLGIAALGKPEGQDCRHCADGQGCGVYAERPAECAEFRCSWLAGLPGLVLPDEARPDRCGVIVCDLLAVPDWRRPPEELDRAAAPVLRALAAAGHDVVVFDWGRAWTWPPRAAAG